MLLCFFRWWGFTAFGCPRTLVLLPHPALDTWFLKLLNQTLLNVSIFLTSLPVVKGAAELAFP